MARDLQEEALRAHRAVLRAGLGAGERDPPAAFAAPPFFVRSSFREGARDLQRPALVDDRHGLAPVADRGPIAVLARRSLLDLLCGTVDESPVVDQLLPLPPGKGERGVERKGSLEERERLVQEGPLTVDGRWPPADLAPHQAQRPAQEIASIGDVGPPGQDVDRGGGVLDCPLEPGVIPGPERTGEGAVERETDTRRGPDMERSALAACVASHVERGQEPGQVRLLQRRAVAGSKVAGLVV